MNLINQNSEIKQYFETLPPYLQENILQSGVDVQSLEQLKKIAENFNNR